MTKQHTSSEAMPRALWGSFALANHGRGRSSAPLVAIWLPLATKVIATALVAVVMAVIGTKAGAHVPTVNVELPAASEPSVALAQPHPHEPDDAGFAVVSAGDAGVETSSAVLADGRIVLNLASEAELIQLPGIGPTRARAILALRQRLTRFRAVEDLLRVKGIGRKTLRRLRPSVVVDRPPSEGSPGPVSP